MGGERDEDEYRHTKSELGGIEVGAIAADHAGLLQPLSPARALRGGQTHNLRQLLVGQRAIVLQREQASGRHIDGDNSCVIW